MNVRAKFVCFKSEYAGGETIKYTFTAVTADEIPENQRYHKYTPGGKLEVWVNNPDVSFEEGKSYYLDFSQAE